MNTELERKSLFLYRRPAGFSLIELLIVVSIILIIAAIAIPRFLNSKMQANETSAASAARTITTAIVTYQSNFNGGLPPTLAALGPGGGPPTAAAADLIDGVLASGTKSGYVFVYTPTDINGDGQFDIFTINANPSSPGVTGQKYFFTDQTNVIRFAVGAAANASSTPIPQQ